MNCSPIDQEVFLSLQKFSGAQFTRTLEHLFSLMDEAMSRKKGKHFILPPLDPSAKKALLLHAHNNQITLSLMDKSCTIDGARFSFSEIKVIS